MELKDFTEKEQEMIKKGLTTSKISDKETAEKIQKSDKDKVQ